MRHDFDMQYSGLKCFANIVDCQLIGIKSLLIDRKPNDVHIERALTLH